jgi:aminopeptidase N
MIEATPKTTYLKDYRPPAFLIDRVALRVELGETETLVHARLELRRNPDATEREESLRLHGEGLEPLACVLDGVPLEASRLSIDGEGLTLLGMPDRGVLETQVRIHPERNTALEGLYRSGAMFCTQCEAEGFRKITWFLDRPDVMARFTTTIVADAARYPVLLSNGNPVGQGRLEDGRHWVRWEDPFPKPAYLFALVAGDLRAVEDRFTTASGREVALRIFVEPENLDKCDHAMSSLKKAMRWDEQVYGREYDLDLYMIVAVNDFNMGAMENKGLNLFNAKFVLASPETATDSDFDGIEGVIAHEYFHNWTGNRITCRDWFQLSLKEGFTVFRDQEFSADMGSRGVKRIQDVRRLRQYQFAEDAGPMAHPVRPDAYLEINNFYTMTVYEKGAEVVRMQARLLGPERFRRATDLYFQRHDGQAVTTEDFVRCMEEAGGLDLGQFRRWYEQAGTPLLAAQGRYDPEARRYSLLVTQSCPPTPGQPVKAPLHIPLAVGLLDGQGRELVPTRLLEVRSEQQSFVFDDIQAPPIPSLLRGFSAPVRLQYDYSDQELALLLAHDSDGFSRWDAAQTLAQRILLQRLADPQAVLPAHFVAAFRQALADAGTDPALLAECLELPSEAYLGDQMAQVDPEAIHAARESVLSALAAALGDEWLASYQGCRDDGPYRITPAAIGRRKLKRLSLEYLMHGPGTEGLTLCVAQYRQGHNMTEVQAALNLLAHSDAPEREEVLADFERRWQHDPLVMDKWFSAQALSQRADTLAQVQRLEGHPAFSLRNPNKVRALIGAFCNQNPARFHAADGSGYSYLVERVLALDPLNPQIAARLLRAIARWRRYDPARQALMKAGLERVAGSSGISRDLYEVAAKSLE